LRKPQNVNASARVFLSAPNDVRERQIADLNLNGDRNAVHRRAHVGPDFAQAPFKLDIRDMRRIRETRPNFRFTAAVILTFAKVILARSFWRMRKMVESSFPAS
jgi:hypothetical protein